jgi:predicted house-cleaning noncanonical NTP pyrophosphatase (MazG superfamily)
MQKNKLVRDKIPHIIVSTGKKPVTRILEAEEYKQELIKKLLEEAQEFATDQNIEELADLMEVIQAIQQSFGFSQNELEMVKNKKLKERGGFAQRIYLQEVIEK